MTMERLSTSNPPRGDAVERPHCSEGEFNAYARAVVARNVGDYIVVGTTDNRAKILDSVVDNLLVQCPHETSRIDIMQQVLHLFSEAVIRTKLDDDMISAYETRAAEQQQEIERLRQERERDRKAAEASAHARAEAVQDFVSSHAQDSDILEVVSEYFGDAVPEIGNAIDNVTRAERIQAEREMIMAGMTSLPSADAIDARLRATDVSSESAVEATVDTAAPTDERVVPSRKRMRFGERAVAVAKFFLEEPTNHPSDSRADVHYLAQFPQMR